MIKFSIMIFKILIQVCNFGKLQNYVKQQIVDLPTYIINM